MSTIVIGFVPTPEGRAAVRHGAREARLRGSSIVLVASARGRELDSEDQTDIERALEAARQRLVAMGLQATVRQLARGKEPSQDLCAVADELHAELIVIGLRRRSPVGKLIMGSNSQQILLDASVPVLAVKASAEDISPEL